MGTYDRRHRRHRQHRRHWRGGTATVTALAGLALVAFGPAGVAVGAREYAQRQAQEAATTQHYLGTEVRDGPVAFVVHKVHCGDVEDGATHGQLCEVTIGARNDGAEKVTVPGSAQMLYGPAGARHRSASAGAKPFGALAPGEAATATLTFDVPAQLTATHVEVHAGPYTRGQPVAIGGPPLPLVRS